MIECTNLLSSKEIEHIKELTLLFMMATEIVFMDSNPPESVSGVRNDSP